MVKETVSDVSRTFILPFIHNNPTIFPKLLAAYPQMSTVLESTKGKFKPSEVTIRFINFMFGKVILLQMILWV